MCVKRRHGLTALSVYMQAREHAKQARLNDAFPLSLHWLTRSLSLAALPILALAFAGLSLPPMTTADLAKPPVLPANAVSIVLLAAASAWALLCLMHVRMERDRCDLPLLLLVITVLLCWPLQHDKPCNL